MFQSKKIYSEDSFAKDGYQNSSNEGEEEGKTSKSTEFFQLYNVHYQNHHTDILWNHSCKTYKLPLQFENVEGSEHGIRDAGTTAVCFFSDQNDKSKLRVVTGGNLGLVSVWDAVSVNRISSFHCKLPKAKITFIPRIDALAAHYDPREGKTFIVVGGGSYNNGGLLFIWDFLDNIKIDLLPVNNRVFRKQISSISLVTLEDKVEPTTLIIVGSYDKIVSIWKFETKEFLFLLPAKHSDLLLSLTTLLISPQDLYIMTSSWDKTILIWKVNPLSPDIDHPTHQLRGHRKSVTCIACCRVSKRRDENDKTSFPDITDDAAILVSGSLDHTIIVWDFETKQIIRTLSGHSDKVSTISILMKKDSPEFPLIISGSEDKIVKLWDLATGCMIRSISCDLGVQACKALEGRFGVTIAVGTSREAVLYNLSEVQKVKSFHTSSVTCVVVYTPKKHSKDPYSSPIVLIAGIDGFIHIFDLFDHRPIEVLKIHDHRINQMLLYIPPEDSNDNPIGITIDGKGGIKTWDLFTYTKLQEETLSNNTMSLCVALHDPSEMNRKLQRNSRKKFREEEEKTEEKSDQEGNDDEVNLNKVFIVTGDTGLNLTYWGLSLSSNSRSLQPNLRQLKVVKRVHRSLIRSILIHYPSSDSNNTEPDLNADAESGWLITCSYDRTVKVLDLRSGEVLFQLDGVHTDYIFSLAIYDPLDHLGSSDLLPSISNRVIRPEFLSFPTLVTCSYDTTIGVWHLNRNQTTARTVTYHLKKHKEAVSALQIYTPARKEENPLIISGSIDGMILIWDLFSGEYLRKLTGQLDRVAYLTIYVNLEDNQPGRHAPILLSGGDDRQTIVWEDVLNVSPSLPLRDDVNRCFQSDCMKQDWPLITEMIQSQYPNDASLFFENHHLFLIALLLNQMTFLFKFRKYFTLFLPRLQSYQGKSILAWSIQQKNLIAIRLILASWTEQLNQDIYDLYTQRIAHAMYYFPSNELSLLANDYPLEFEIFIIGLRLIKNHHTFLMTEEKYLQYCIFESKYDFITLHDIIDDYGYNSDDNDNDDNREGEREINGSLLDNSIEMNQIKFKMFKQLLFNRKQQQQTIAAAATSNNANGQTSWGKKRFGSEFNQKFKNIEKQLMKPEPENATYSLPPRFRFATAGSNSPIIRFDRLWKKLFSFTSSSSSPLTRYDSHKNTTISKFLPSHQALFVQLFDAFIRFQMKIESFFNQDRIRPQSVTSLMIPFRNIHHHLKSIVLVTKGLDSVDLLKSDVVIVLLNYYWEEYGQRPHFFATIRYLIFLILFITSMYAYEIYYMSNDNQVNDDGGGGGGGNVLSAAERVLVQVLNAVVFAFLVYYLYEEMHQINYTVTFKPSTSSSSPGETGTTDRGGGEEREENAIKKTRNRLNRLYQTLFKFQLHFFNDFWNAIDIVIVSTGIPGMTLRFIYDYDTITGRCFLSICSIALWVKVLFFFRPYHLYGPLVTSIVQVMQSAYVYVFILFCVLAGFTQAFWLLSNFDSNLPWGTISQALLTSFFNLLGQNIESNFSQLASSNLATVFIVFFMMIMIIFMLNLFIAFLSNIFNSLQENTLAIWRKEQASMLIEESFLFQIDHQKVHSYIHILKYTTDLIDRDKKMKNNQLEELNEISKESLELFSELRFIPE